MSKKITVIGECMIELSEKDANARRDFGDDTLSTSAYVAHQVDPAALTVHYVAALGTSSFSQQTLDAWHDESADTSLTQRMGNHLPDLYYIETDSTGERTFYYWCNETTAKFWLENEQSAAVYEELANFDYLYLNGINLAILSPTSREGLLSPLRECRANGGKVIFDNNYHLRLWASREETQQMYQQMPECADIAFLTLDDEDALQSQQPMEDVVMHTRDAGMKGVAMKRGADSYLVSIAGEGLVDVPAVKLPKERVIDTTAAGDSFGTGCPVIRLMGGSAENAAKRGHLIAGTVIQYRDAIIPRKAMPA